jgi:hypothetical protein
MVFMVDFPAVFDYQRVDQMTNRLNGLANGANIGKYFY